MMPLEFDPFMVVNAGLLKVIRQDNVIIQRKSYSIIIGWEVDCCCCCCNDEPAEVVVVAPFRLE